MTSPIILTNAQRLLLWRSVCVGLLALNPIAQQNAVAASPVAFVVDNSDYTFALLDLPASASDADNVYRHLVAAGFSKDRIIVVHDPTKDDFDNLLQMARAKYVDASAVVFYYSGHGILYEGTQNGRQFSRARLIPKDFSFVDLAAAVGGRDLLAQTVGVADILAVWKDRTEPALFIFDACRDDGKDAAGTDLAGKLAALALTRQAAGTGSSLGISPDRTGTFDNQGDDKLRLDASEDLSRTNALVLLGAVRSMWGAGISYERSTADGSELTASLLAKIDADPSRGIGEIFPTVKPQVIADTMHDNPPQVPHAVDYFLGNWSLAQLGSGVFNLPAPSVLLTRQNASDIAKTLSDIKNVQKMAAPNRLAAFVSLRTISQAVRLDALAAFAQRLSIASPAVAAVPRQSPASLVETEAANRSVRITAHLWEPADTRVYGDGGTLPALNLPASNVIAAPALDGRIELRQAIIADPGFRIVSVASHVSVARNLLRYAETQKSDTDGVLEVDKLWALPATQHGQPDGSLVAHLTVVERVPHGSRTLPITGIFKIDPKAALVLKITSADAAALDQLDVIDSRGSVIAKLKVGEMQYVDMLRLRLALVRVGNGLVLQSYL